MNVALVYDRVNKWGGAERILLALHDFFPKAPLYTSVYNPKTAPWASVFEVKTSFLQNFPKAKSSHELYAALMPLAFESFCFDEYDLVISLTSEAAKGIITKPKTLHVCYCLTPTRYLWSGYNDYFKNPILRFVSKPVVSYLQNWDKVASQRPDMYFAISKEVQKRIKKYYNRDSKVIYPPITLFGASRLSHVANDAQCVQSKKISISPSSLSERRLLNVDVNSNIKTESAFSSFASGQAPIALKGKYFLIVSRLVAYKRVDIAIEAFNKLGFPLKIVGTGSQERQLRVLARSNIEFLGNLTDEKLLGYYKDCLALVFPGREDLGLTILEAQSFGKPVIALRAGGALETIIEGKTGEFFDEQHSSSLVKVLKSFDTQKYKSQDCIENAKNFSYAKFEKNFLGILKSHIKNQ